MNMHSEEVELLGVEKIYEYYTEYMNSRCDEQNWSPFIITPINDYFENNTEEEIELVLNEVPGLKDAKFVLEQYNSDYSQEGYATFKDAFAELLSGDAENVEKAIKYHSESLTPFLKLLKKNEISAYELSKQTKIPQTTLSKYVRGETDGHNMSLKNAWLISGVLDITLDELYTNLLK